MKFFNEGCSLVVSAEFLSDEGTPTSPTSVEWKLRNTTTKTTVQDWTPVAVSTAVEISIDAALVRIERSSNTRETQELTITSDRGLATQQNETLRWEVINLDAV